ncbi:hypothetical protein [Croceivirga thetidis]|uniref:DUF4105 domain-containing protein n=1 Tax=Croceivirga thetidis TaxID=2721623 RepID=A0ABX1GRV6_9FLAO|nr:hypothetical protein [Croceivirga thetidis]NKI32339.1 hypothetical protein [Croceivirga thetidis]
MIKRFFVFLLLVCITCTLDAQKRNFNEGYIIEKSGDTIYGLLKDRSPEPFVSLYDKVRFKSEGKSRTKRYGPNDILGYGYEGRNYEAVPFREESDFLKFRYYTDNDSPRAFLRLIAHSENLMYYEQEFVHDDNSYVESVPFFYRPGSREMLRVTQGLFGFKKKKLRAYFFDCPELQLELQKKNTQLKTVWDLYEFCETQCFE